MIQMLYVGGPTAAEKGAVGTHTSGVINALTRRGDVNLHGAFCEGALPSALPSDIEQFSRSKLSKKLGKIGKILSFFEYSFFIRKLLRAKQSDYVYVRFDPFFCFVLILVLGKSRIIIEYNDIFMDQIRFAADKGEWSGLSKTIRLSPFYRYFVHKSESLVFSKSHLVVAVTEDLLKYCKSRCHRLKGITVFNATDLKFSEFPKSINAPTEVLKLAHVGTLTYWDGLEELLLSLKKAQERARDFRFELIFVGDGKMRAQLETLVDTLGFGSNVRFLEPIERSKAVEVLKSTDVVPILKTIVGYGLSPMKFYEALGAGCHVLASDVPHMNEESPEYVTNVCFPLDIEEISEKLIFIFHNLKHIRGQKMAVSKYAQDHHSWEARVEALINSIEGMQ
jgi:glycosyltransferase involved in cell wall biosynthesis